MQGWELIPAVGDELSLPVRAVRQDASVQDGLF